jgi:tRNA(Arg) A34 adenosine deaminase TadA
MPSKFIVEQAIKVAKKSKEEFLVGAVLYKGSSILRTAFNNNKYIGYRENIFPFRPTRHAEILILHNVPRDILSLCSILVVRVDRQGNLTSGKPCKACIKALLKARVRKIYYSSYDSNIKLLNISEIDLNEYTKELR